MNRDSRRRRSVIALVLILSGVATAQGIQKWRTNDGQLYFGDRPPPGSTLLGGTESIGTTGGGDVAPPIEQHGSYILINPQAHDSAQKYPLLIFLHGQGGSPQSILDGHKAPFARRRFFISLPHGPEPQGDGFSWYDRSDAKRFTADLDRDEQFLKGMIDEIASQHAIDRSRIFLAGFSAGARVSLYVGFRNPQLFRELLPIGGYYMSELLDPYVANLKALKISLYHGTSDALFSFDEMNRSYENLRRRGVDVTLTAYPLGHTYDDQVLEKVLGEVN